MDGFHTICRFLVRSSWWAPVRNGRIFKVLVNPPEIPACRGVGKITEAKSNCPPLANCVLSEGAIRSTSPPCGVKYANGSD